MDGPLGFQEADIRSSWYLTKISSQGLKYFKLTTNFAHSRNTSELPVPTDGFILTINTPEGVNEAP